MHNNPVVKEKLPKLFEGWEWIDKNEYGWSADFGTPIYGKWIAVLNKDKDSFSNVIAIRLKGSFLLPEHYIKAEDLIKVCQMVWSVNNGGQLIYNYEG